MTEHAPEAPEQPQLSDAAQSALAAEQDRMNAQITEARAQYLASRVGELAVECAHLRAALEDALRNNATEPDGDPLELLDESA